MGSVPNCRKEIAVRYPIRWFKCKLKPPKKQDDDDDDDDEDEDETYYLSQDYGDDSNVDPEYRPSKKELKGADKEGDQ